MLRASSLIYSLVPISLFALRSFAGDPCPELYRFTPHLGTPVGTSESPSELLGKGAWGSVYRVYRDGKPLIWKTYSNTLVVKNDVEGFRALQRISEEHPGVFSVSRVLEADEHALFLENVQGRTLQDVIRNKRLPLIERIKLKRKYDSLVALLESEVPKHFPLLLKQRKGLAGYPAWSSWEALGLSVRRPGLHRDELIFFFKPDNIIVDPVDLHFTIIDPY